MRRRVTVVCVFVCHAMLYQATWYIYTLKVRYHRILHELFKSFDSWISLKVFGASLSEPHTSGETGHIYYISLY